MPFPDLGDIQPLVPPLTGNLKNIETLYPEWNIDSEPWGEAIAEGQVPNLQYLSDLSIVSESPILKVLGLDVEVATDPKAAKAKPPAKKGGKDAAPVELVELDVDEAGRKLPKVYIDTDTFTFSGFEPARKYQSSSDSTLHAFNDHIMVTVFEFVKRFGTPFFTSKDSPLIEGGDNMEYLWRSIYPKLSNGKPCYNAAGRYCVRLFFAGKWRKVYVNDSVPVIEDGKCGVISSEDALELWPMLLSKAVYSLFYVCG